MWEFFWGDMGPDIIKFLSLEEATIFAVKNQIAIDASYISSVHIVDINHAEYFLAQ
jgi:hypothetical protein